jgi:hypothetical protein
MGKCLVHTDCKWPIEGVNYSCEYHTKTTFVGLDKLINRMNAIVSPMRIGGRDSLERELIDSANKCGFNKPVIADLWDTDNVYFFELSKVDRWEIDEDGNHVQLWEQVLTWEGKELEPRDRVGYELELREEYERKREESEKQFNRGWDDRQKKSPRERAF